MANNFDQDFENYYYRGNPNFKSDEILTNYSEFCNQL